MVNKSLTLKQRQFVKKYLENGGNGTRAALAVYNTKDSHTAHQIAYENLRKPAVFRQIEASLERVGLSDESIAEMLRESIEAGLGVKATNADTLRGIEMLLKLKGYYPIQKSAHLRVNLGAGESFEKRLENMSYKEVLEELKKQRERTADLLKDVEAN